MPEIQRDDMGNVMPAIQNQIGVAPNKEAALLAGLTSTSPIARSIGQNLLSKKLEGPRIPQCCTRCMGITRNT
jgi:hypothetical protein